MIEIILYFILTYLLIGISHLWLTIKIQIIQNGPELKTGLAIVFLWPFNISMICDWVRKRENIIDQFEKKYGTDGIVI